jgi:MFS family permease
MAVQGGFVAGTLASAMLNLPDVINARRLFAAGCICGAAANAGLVGAPTAVSLIALRVATGVSLAWVYPPGMKIAAGWFRERRGAALGVLIGALTTGSAFPHLLAATSASVPWRVLMLGASALAIVAAGVVKVFVEDGPFVAASAPFRADAVLRVFADRGTRLATLGYLGHMWELYAVWTWIAAFATAGVYPSLASGVAPSSRVGSAIAFLMIASGAAGSAMAGWSADTIGKSRIARWAMIASGACAAISWSVFGAPLPIVAAFAVVWGVAVVADSAQLSALVAQYSPRDHVGTALTIQMCAGFLLTMASIRLIPALAHVVGWQWAFVVLVPGPALGALALRGLDDRTQV